MSLDDLLKSLHQEYISALPEKLTKIEQQIQRQDRDSLRESFHKLKGTGMTYGLPEVSQVGEVAEDICLQKPAQAIEAAHLALAILRDIHQTRAQNKSFDCLADARFAAIQKVLQN
jgi:HPt (histidine-containing phosphotransfer) domain-containing protein